MNLANKITFTRILLIPIFLICISIKHIPYGTTIATIIFIVAALTDSLDGYIARSRKQVTNLGKFMDPLADKLLVSTALIALVECKMIPGWVTIIIISRELAVTGLRAIAASEGRVIAASNWGKAKTVTQIIAIVFALINLDHGFTALVSLTNLTNLTIFNKFISFMTNTTIAIALFITLISGVDYFIKNKDAIRLDAN
jgi:CDP-diacylglycerol---glycerol-3-phosphate 3-phosphatidyltransferase